MLNPGNAPSFTLPGTYTDFPFLSIAAFGNLSYKMCIRDRFSVSPASVLAVRYQISRWNREAASEVAEEAMKLESAEEVESFLKRKTD